MCGKTDELSAVGNSHTVYFDDRWEIKYAYLLKLFARKLMRSS